MTGALPVRAPSLALLFAEPGRALAEFGLLAPGLPLLAAAPGGDGHPVLVLPGMGGDDRSTLALRRFLRRKGYWAHGWKHGRNVGSTAIVPALRARIADLHERHGKPVSLVGWSLGGIYARELARALPEHVRQVITLGSPFRGPYKASNVWRIYEMLSGNRGSDEAAAHLAECPPVPTTAIFTRTDGIVAWQRCVEPRGATSESVEVVGSHSGLGHNALAMFVIADRLAQPQGTWAPFAPRGALRKLYPDPWRDQAA